MIKYYWDKAKYVLFAMFTEYSILYMLFIYYLYVYIIEYILSAFKKQSFNKKRLTEKRLTIMNTISSWFRWISRFKCRECRNKMKWQSTFWINNELCIFKCDVHIFIITYIQNEKKKLNMKEFINLPNLKVIFISWNNKIIRLYHKKISQI